MFAFCNTNTILICLCHQFQTSTRLTSQAFQRWMCVIVGVVMFWSTTLIVKWLTTSPTLSGVMSFVFPLLVLPLLASAYAEVNYEGLRVLQVYSYVTTVVDKVFYRH